MKNIQLAIIAVFVAAAMISCSSEEGVIDNYTNTGTYLFADSNIMNKYSLLDSSFAPLNLSFEIKGKINKIKHFRENYYLVVPSDFAIYVIKDKSYELVAKVDYLASNMPPTDICFPNATDAYVCHSGSGTVTILDITSYSIAASQIQCSGTGYFAIEGMGNQVYACANNKSEGSDDTVSVIDTRTLKNYINLPVSPYPRYIASTYDGKSIYVVSLGCGKEDEVEAKSPAYVTVIDITQKEPAVSSKIMLGSNNESAQNVYPTGLAISQKNAYISSNSNLWKIVLSSAKTAASLLKTSCKLLEYNYIRDEIYFIESKANANSILTVYDATSNERKSSHIIKSNIDAIIAE